MRLRNQLLICLLAVLPLAACQNYQPTRGVEPGAVERDPGVCYDCGSVQDVRRVSLSDDGIGLGAVVGAVIGAAAGSQVGSGTGQDIATAAGAVGGAAAGHEIEKRNREADIAYQFSVKLDDGRFATVTQREHYGLDVGDRVRLENDRILPI
ncbi:MAG: glycine zipper 2TM domain-containing protein [Xanthomonadales bacterium]|nr:glycine zipper 2TM domain-containing protein [Xanthomonadales bacterium]